MKKLILFFVVMITAVGAKAGDVDTAWTRNLGLLGSSIEQVQFTPDGQGVAVAIGGGVYILDIKTGEIVKKFDKYMFSCDYFDFSLDGKKLIINSHDQNYKANIHVWDINSIDTIKNFSNIGIHQIKTYDEHTMIGVSSNSDQTSKIFLYNFNLENGTTIKGPEINDAETFAILKEKGLLSTINYNENTKSRSFEIRDYNTLHLLFTLGDHNSSINDLAFSPDGKYLASAGSDGLIKIWDLIEMKLYKTVTHSSMKDGYLHCKFSPQGGYLVSSGGTGFDFTTKVWDFANNKIIYQYSAPLGAQYSMDISIDSNYLAIGRGPNIILINSRWEPNSVEKSDLGQICVLYPNPATDFIDITLPNVIQSEAKNPEIKIFDVFGRAVNLTPTLSIHGEGVRLDVSSLSPGLYFVRVGDRVGKFVKI